jgi:hypothetical protein
VTFNTSGSFLPFVPTNFGSSFRNGINSPAAKQFACCSKDNGMRAILGFLSLLLGAVLLLDPGNAQPQAQPFGLTLELQGPIGPATTGYLEKGLARAEAENAHIVILLMDTPGGLESSMRGHHPRNPEITRSCHHLRYPVRRTGNQRRCIHPHVQSSRGDDTRH